MIKLNDYMNNVKYSLWVWNNNNISVISELQNIQISILYTIHCIHILLYNIKILNI